MRVADSPLSVYTWMGPDDSPVDFLATDFLDLGWWKPVRPSTVFPSGFNLTDSHAVAIAAAIVLNDLRSDVTAALTYADATADSLVVEAIEQALIRADADVTASASGGNSVTGEGTALAAGGIIATNRVLGGATASVLWSTVDIETDITVRALLRAEIEASARAALTSGAQTFSVVLAFNTIGWNPTAYFFETLQAILGSPVIGGHTAFGNEHPAVARALVQQSALHAGGAVAVVADASATISAHVGNDATSYPAALFGAEGLAMSGVVASNRVSSGASAQIEGVTPADWTLASPPGQIEPGDVVLTATGRFQWTGLERGPPASDENFLAPGWRRIDDISSVVSAGSLTVDALSAAVIGATTTLFSEIAPNNDAGSGLINRYLGDQLDDYLYTSNSGLVTLDLGDRVWADDQVFEWMGLDGTPVELADTDFEDTELWKLLSPTNLFTSSLAYALLGEIGTLLNKPKVGASAGYFGLVVTNDLRSSTLASISDTPVDADGDVTVQATDVTSLTAQDSSTILAWGGGGGVLAMNAILGSAQALVTRSPITAGGDLLVQAAQSGDAVAATQTHMEAWDAFTVILAFNSLGWTSQNLLSYLVEAILGVSAADIADRFGTGSTPVVTATFGDQQPAIARAVVTDSPLDIDGTITVTAISSTILNAVGSNENIVSAAVDITFGAAGQKADKKTGAVAGYGASGTATGILVATNKVNSLAYAEIVFTGPALGTVGAGGDVTISAFDTAGVTATATVIQDVATSNTLAGIADVLNQIVIPGDYEFTTASGPRSLVRRSSGPEPGDPPIDGTRVRVGQSWVDAWLAAHPGVTTAPVVVGDVYEYLGGSGLIDLRDILAADFTNAAQWERIVAGSDDLGRFYPNIGNLTDSDARSIGILVILNDVRSSVTAKLVRATVTAPSLTVAATEDAWLVADVLLNVLATGGSFYGTGDVLSVAAQIATNRVLGSATALVQNSVLDLAGDLVVTATNSALIDATLLTSAYSGADSVGVVLAFNTVGWKSTNVLFNAIDAILGDPSSAACSAKSSRRSRVAKVLDTVVDAERRRESHRDQRRRDQRHGEQRGNERGLGPASTRRAAPSACSSRATR